MQKDTHNGHSAHPEQNSEEHVVQTTALAEIPDTEPSGPTIIGNNLHFIKGVKITLMARVGDAEISVGDLFSLKNGSVLKLDRLTTDPVDILLDGNVIARGTLVAADDHFGVSVTELPQTQTK